MFDLSSFMSQRTFQNTNSTGQALILEQLGSRQDSSAVVEVAHSVAFLDGPARINTSRAPLISGVAFQCVLERCPGHTVFPTGKCAKISQKFLKSWLGRYHTVSRAHFPPSATVSLAISGASSLAFWRICNCCVLNL